ncbi:hypothetical protein Tco_0028079 [Tanacetum coccineum]
MEIRQFLGLAGYYRRFIEEGESDSLCIPSTQDPREKLYSSRFGVKSCSVGSQDLEALLILNAQAKAMKEENVKEENLCGMNKEFGTRPDGTLFIEKRSWLPHLGGLRDLIMLESRKSKYFIPSRSDKM